MNGKETHLRRIIAELLESLRHPLTANVGAVAASRYIAAAFSFLTAVIASRALGPGGYGAAVLAMAVPGLIFSIANIKTVSVSLRYTSVFVAEGRDDELHSLAKFGYLLDAGIGMAVLLIVAALAPLVSRVVPAIGGMEWLAIAFAVSFPFQSLEGTSWSVLSAYQRFRLLATIEISGRALTFLLVAGSLSADLGIEGVVLATGAGQALGGVLMLTLTARTLNREGHREWWKAGFVHIAPLRRELRNLLGWNYLLITLVGVLQQAPVLILGRWRSEREVGFYRLASSLVGLAASAEGSLGRVTYPTLAARAASSMEASLQATVRAWRRKAAYPLAMLLVLVIPVLPFVVRFVFGDEFEGMTGVAQVMLGGAAVSLALFYLGPFHYATNSLDRWTKAFAAYVIVAVIGCFLVAEPWGFTGIGIVLGTASAMFNLVMAFAVRRDFDRSRASRETVVGSDR
ncbi:MAG: lipopolysaccharide biosynthesis protein [Actinomycetota bacterium]